MEKNNIIKYNVNFSTIVFNPLKWKGKGEWKQRNPVPKQIVQQSALQSTESFHITATSKNNYFRIYKMLRHIAEAAIATHFEGICVGNKHDADSKKR